MNVTLRGHDFEITDSPAAHLGGWDFWEAASNGSWEGQSFDVLDEYLKGGLFVDIGAWIGPLSVYASAFGPVVAFEPDPAAFADLIANTKGLPVDCRQLALSDVAGIVELRAQEYGWGSSMTSMVTHPDGPSIVVDTLTLPEAFAGLGTPDLIKMDIEGGESIVLPHAEPFLRELGVPMLLSLHPDYADMGPVREALKAWDWRKVWEEQFVVTP